MIGAIIGAGLTLAGSALNAAKGASEARKQRLYLNERMKETKDKMANEIYGDATQSAEAQRSITMADKAYQQAVDRASNAVTGGNLDRAKLLESANEARAQAAADITANAEAVKRQQKQIYENRIENLEDAKMQVNAQQAANAQAGFQSLANAGSSLLAADLSGMLDGRSGSTGGTQKAPALDYKTTLRLGALGNSMDIAKAKVNSDVMASIFKPLRVR